MHHTEGELGTTVCTLRYGLLGKRVHLHGDGKVIETVQELTELFELVECDSLNTKQRVV